MKIREIISRNTNLFDEDISQFEDIVKSSVESSSFLVVGGAGSIGSEVVKEIFSRNPKSLHVIDINENNLAELVRDLRSSFGYIDGEFKTFVLDLSSNEFDVFFREFGQYDYVLNLAALKHVRSEKDPYTLMRLIDVNIVSAEKLLNLCISKKVSNYFCVSTDKAANPVNLMGASKKIMEMIAIEKSCNINVSMARFANVAFSDGSLLHGFKKRIEKNQPIAAPNDVKRYFITPKESGELCLMSCIFGKNSEIFFPKLTDDLRLIDFVTIVENFLHSINKKPLVCSSEHEARNKFTSLDLGSWPCYFSKSTTTGEKDFEEFFTKSEEINNDKFKSIGIIENLNKKPNNITIDFLNAINVIKLSKKWSKSDIVREFKKILPDFDYNDKNEFLDDKM